MLAMLTILLLAFTTYSGGDTPKFDFAASSVLALAFSGRLSTTFIKIKARGCGPIKVQHSKSALFVTGHTRNSSNI